MSTDTHHRTVAEAIWKDHQSGMSWVSFFTRSEQLCPDQNMPATDSEIIEFVQQCVEMPKTRFKNRIAPVGWSYRSEEDRKELMEHVGSDGTYPERFRNPDESVRTEEESMSGKRRLGKAGKEPKPKTFVVMQHGPNGKPRPMGTSSVQAATLAEAVAALVTENTEYVTVHTDEHNHTVIRRDRRMAP